MTIDKRFRVLCECFKHASNLVRKGAGAGAVPSWIRHIIKNNDYAILSFYCRRGHTKPFCCSRLVSDNDPPRRLAKTRESFSIRTPPDTHLIVGLHDLYSN